MVVQLQFGGGMFIQVVVQPAKLLSMGEVIAVMEWMQMTTQGARTIVLQF